MNITKYTKSKESTNYIFNCCSSLCNIGTLTDYSELLLLSKALI